MFIYVCLHLQFLKQAIILQFIYDRYCLSRKKIWLINETLPLPPTKKVVNKILNYLRRNYILCSGNRFIKFPSGLKEIDSFKAKRNSLLTALIENLSGNECHFFFNSITRQTLSLGVIKVNTVGRRKILSCSEKWWAKST